MKKVLGIILLLAIIGGGVGYYLFNKPTESLKDAPAVLCVSADSLFASYEMDENGANTRFLDKIIEVDGKVQSVNTDTSGLSLTLQTGSGMFGVICKLEDKSTPESSFTIGQAIRLKGQCTGYLMDVVLIRCIVQE